jgi:hypothetical protein
VGEINKSALFAPFPQLARAVSSRGALRLFLVGIEGQELRDSKQPSGGHVQNVRHSMSFGERVGTAQSLCTLMHSRQVHQRRGEQSRVVSAILDCPLRVSLYSEFIVGIQFS